MAMILKKESQPAKMQVAILFFSKYWFLSCDIGD